MNEVRTVLVAPALAAEKAVQAHVGRVRSLLGQMGEAAEAEAAARSAALGRLVGILDRARQVGGTAYVFGNGGSASTANHLASDLTRAVRGARPLRAFSLAGNVSLLSGLANDFGYDSVFVRQLAAAQLQPHDVVIGISASGESENCVRALTYARERGAATFGLLGFSGGRMRALCDHFVHLPCDDYGAVEDAHLVLCHALVRALSLAAPELRDPPRG